MAQLFFSFQPVFNIVAIFPATVLINLVGAITDSFFHIGLRSFLRVGSNDWFFLGFHLYLRGAGSIFFPTALTEFWTNHAQASIWATTTGQVPGAQVIDKNQTKIRPRKKQGEQSKATPFQQLSSGSNVQQNLSAEQLQHIAEMFERNLGRELTPDERKYLGLSAAMVSVDDFELRHEKQRNQAQKQSGAGGRKELSV
jgi:hypothetical protein